MRELEVEKGGRGGKEWMNEPANCCHLTSSLPLLNSTAIRELEVGVDWWGCVEGWREDGAVIMA